MNPTRCARTNRIPADPRWVHDDWFEALKAVGLEE
jgi:hypothetical protein